MVGQVIGAAAQIGSSIYGAIKSSQANKRAEQLLQNQREENKKWYDQKMNEDYTQRTDVQNVLRKQRELLQEQYQRARATNLVAGGTDESLALQQAAANETMGETMANIAEGASSYKEGIENKYRENEAAFAQQEIANEKAKAQSIATAAGQVGSAVSGLMTGADGSGAASKNITPKGAQAYADAQQLMNKTLEEDLAKADEELLKIKA